MLVNVMNLKRVVSVVHVYSHDRFVNEVTVNSVGSPALVPLDSGKLKAVLNEEEGFHQIGPEDVCADMFVLSVTVAFATKLERVKKLLSYINLITIFAR